MTESHGILKGSSPTHQQTQQQFLSPGDKSLIGKRPSTLLERAGEELDLELSHELSLRLLLENNN